MSTIGAVFTVRKGHKVQHLKSQGVPLDYWYYDDETGRQFDVRELPAEHLKDDGADVRAGHPYAHRRVIQRALAVSFDFKVKH
jgi:hypothetical protein